MTSPRPITEILADVKAAPDKDERFIPLVDGKPTFSPPGKARSRDEVAPELRSLIAEVAMAARPWPLFLYGEAGSGKTCAALCMIDLYGGWYTPLGEMVDRYWMTQRGEWRSSSGYPWTLLELRDMWSHAPLAIIDEIGERDQVSDAHYETTKKLIDWRERDGLRPTVFISNRTAEEIARIYGDPVASRLTCGTVVRVDGDRRRGKQTTVKVQNDNQHPKE